MVLPYVKISGERFIIDLMYARLDNMVEQAVYQTIGWGNLAVVHQDVMSLLNRLEPELKRLKLKLKICDAYRPKIAHEMMKKLIPMKGFFAENAEMSQHCLGTALDVCLCDDEGKEFSYPTKVDAYDQEMSRQVLSGQSALFMEHLQKARHDYQALGIDEEIKNREFLCELMVGAGFEALEHEWWHYNLPLGKIDHYPLVSLKAEDFC